MRVSLHHTYACARTLKKREIGGRGEIDEEGAAAMHGKPLLLSSGCRKRREGGGWIQCISSLPLAC